MHRTGPASIGRWLMLVLAAGVATCVRSGDAQEPRPSGDAARSSRPLRIEDADASIVKAT